MLSEGDCITVVNTHASQVVDARALAPPDLGEHMSMPHTRSSRRATRRATSCWAMSGTTTTAVRTSRRRRLRSAWRVPPLPSPLNLLMNVSSEGRELELLPSVPAMVPHDVEVELQSAESSGGDGLAP